MELTQPATQPGTRRSSKEIATGLEKELRLACFGVKASVTKEQAATGIKDAHTVLDRSAPVASTRAQESPRESGPYRTLALGSEKIPIIRNEIFNINGIGLRPAPKRSLTRPSGFDPTQDSPIEILHTILLGVVKYVWYLSYTKWTDEQKRVYTVRLRATNIDGLKHTSNPVQLHHALIGRQLKSVGQTNAFLTHDICNGGR